MDDAQAADGAGLALEAPAEGVFVPPSVHQAALLAGDSYTHFAPIPPCLLPSGPGAPGLPCALGVDEAGRGPVLGPMVYGVFFLPLGRSDALLRAEHRFDDSKVLTPAVRSALVRALCDPGSSLARACGWAVAALSARDIAAGMLRPAAAAAYNLNAQAMDATADLVRGVLARGVDVREVYVDTIGQPAAYQRRLERLFPSLRITVAKKADSLYPCVSAASVCAKVTRDAALEVLYEGRRRDVLEGRGRGGDGEPEAGPEAGPEAEPEAGPEEGWGSGYPSDARCVAWLRANMHPVFGWGPECRFSWGTAKDMLEARGAGVRVEWPADQDGDTSRMTDYFATSDGPQAEGDELGTWFGAPAGLEAF